MTHTPKRPMAAILRELEQRDLTHDFTLIARKHGVLLDEVMGPRRFGGMTDARHECMALLRDRGWSYPRIGVLFDRDHTTVMEALRANEKRLAKAVMRAIKGAA